MRWETVLVMAGGLLLSAALLRHSEMARTAQAKDLEMRDCPHCGQTICATARMCRSCEQMLVPGLD